MSQWWKVNLWKIVLFPAIAGLIAIGYSLLQGKLHRWLNVDPYGHEIEKKPAARKPIDQGDILKAVHADVKRAEAPQQRRLRYLTLNHRHNEPAVTEAEIQVERQALADLVAALAPPERSATVTAIDKEQLLYRLDLESLGWSGAEWRQVAVLYPYGLRYPSSTEAEAVCQATDDQVPVIRADWFVAAASRAPLGGPGGTLGLWTRKPPEKVAEVARGYNGQPIDLERAARELGSSAAVVRKLLDEEAYLREEFALAPLREGKTIPRDAWESDKNLTTPFQELSKRLGLGKPVRLR